ncbi:cytochrome b561 and DOMON domain-containing protein At3g25290-like [Salvia hispanica]|uniref:cytochrome b561 and DOMON domain-containing protein At3g25290-like n=1 Tax=Salvia hispanica TaxID=49212 RepID=UPI0020097011|nr:cytochrome b561 and DOMON domain-containing protein At3g25290-like [Salvia hispanica]
MASLLFLLLLATPALSLTCKTQTFSKHNLTFGNCTDLSTLDASLHWNYDAAAKPMPTLSIAFTAPPAKPDGWVAWALNPSATGMVGAQSLVAFAAPNGSTLVKTYNITSYGPISESPISYHVLTKSAESSKGAITIFATLALPEGSAKLNQVWQVGSALVDGVPAKHAFAPDNLASKTTLQLAPGGGAPAPAPGFAAGPGGGQSGNVNGGESAWGSGLGVFGICVMLGVSIFGF